jgi:hypothetical protein
MTYILIGRELLVNELQKHVNDIKAVYMQI